MYFPFGPMPEYQNVCRSMFGATATILWSALFVTTLFTLPVYAQHRIPLALSEAEDLALVAEPGQLALRAKAGALKERGVVAGELPDPMLRIGLNNFPLQSGGFTTEGMTSAAVGVRQAFPAGKTRVINTRRFDSLADEMNQNAAARGRNVLTAARQSWLDLYYWERAHALVSESRPFFDDLATITRSLYAVGRKTQQGIACRAGTEST